MTHNFRAGFWQRVSTRLGTNEESMEPKQIYKCSHLSIRAKILKQIAKRIFFASSALHRGLEKKHIFYD